MRRPAWRESPPRLFAARSGVVTGRDLRERTLNPEDLPVIHRRATGGPRRKGNYQRTRQTFLMHEPR